MNKRGMAASLAVAWVASALFAVVAAGCGDDDVTPGVDAGTGIDLGPTPRDSGPTDLGSHDDAAPQDSGTPEDAGPVDLGHDDLGLADLGVRCAPRASGDTRWAQYPMPGTPGHLRSYQVTGTAGSETVIDCVTGLEWQRARDTTMYTQAAAIAYCEGLTLAGYSDWRLPSKIELVTLVDYAIGSPGPTLDIAAFPGSWSERLWSGSPVPTSPTNGWGVNFGGGSVSYTDVAYEFRARCVR